MTTGLQFNIGSARLGIKNNVAVATTSTAVASSAFSTGTHQIRISAPAACFYTIDIAPTATNTDAYLPANVLEYITVNSGQKISVFSATIQTISVWEVS